MNRHRWWLTILALVFLLAASMLILWPLIKPGFFISDDGEWMIIRLSAFYQSFRDGQFPVRFLGRLNQEYGYPVANFLYPGFLYIGSVLHLVGFSFPDSIKVIMGVSVIGSLPFLFLWLRKYVRFPASVLGSLGFLFAPYLVFNIYQRGSVGETVSFFPTAVALASIEGVLPQLFPFAIALLLVSHNSLALLFVIFIGFYLLFRKKRDYWIPLLLGAGMASFFWIPALAERKFVMFDLQTLSRPAAYFVDQHRVQLLNLVPIIAAIVLLTRKKWRARPLPLFFAATFLVSIVMATGISARVWDIPTIGKLFQFPYRFLSLGLFSGAWLIAYVWDHASKITRILLGITFLVLWLSPIIGLSRQIRWVIRPEGYYTTNEATTTVADEYMPRWVKEKPKERPVRKMEFIEGRGTIVLRQVSTRKIEASIVAKEKSIIGINSIFYPGWGVEVDNVPSEIFYRNPQGVMHVIIPSGEHRIVAEFRETPTRLFADVLSVISGMVALAVVL